MRRGIIVGSSDLERVGTSHEPSAEAIKKKITTVQNSSAHLHTTKQSSGAKPGLTLALTLGDEVVGAVAITGDPAEVEKFGMIIKSQTENYVCVKLHFSNPLSRKKVPYRV